MHIEKKTLRNIFVGVAICIVLYWILHETERVKAVYAVLKSVFSPFVLGSCIAFILNVPMRSIEGWLKGVKKQNLRRVLALLLTFMAVLLVVTLVCLLLIPQISDTFQSLVSMLPDFIDRSEQAIKGFLNNNPEVMTWIAENTELENINISELLKDALSVVGNSVSTILGTTVSAIGSITTGAFNAVIAIVFAIYCLFQKETLARQGRRLLYALLPEGVADEIIRILRLSNVTFSNFLSGQCIEVCILGALFAVSMAIFRMPYIPLVSVLVAVTAFIPVVGAWAGCVLGAFFILVANPLQAVWFVVMFIVLQQIENNLIYPRVVGTSIGLSGMWVLLAVAVGGEFMGVAGMFLMIPIASVLYTLLREFTNKRLAGRDIDPEKLADQPIEFRSKFREALSRKRTKPAKKSKEESQENK